MGRSNSKLGRTKPIKTEEQKQKAREYARQWRINNPDKCREYHRVYAEKYPDKERERHREKSARLRKLYPERQSIADRKWMETNREAHRAKSQRRRVKERNNKTFLILPKELKKLYSQPCINCGSKDRITADHIIPVARGGQHSVGNLQPLCMPCNSSKNSRTMTEWKLLKEKNNDRYTNKDCRRPSNR